MGTSLHPVGSFVAADEILVVALGLSSCGTLRLSSCGARAQ